MAKFEYVLTAAFKVEALNSDEAYDKFQKMTLDQAYWDNTNTGVELIEGEEEWDHGCEYCQNDGKLENDKCSKCDAIYPEV